MKTKAITEGALISAIAVILALLCYYVPFMIILYIFIPVPIVVLALRQGMPPAVLSSIAASFILFFLIDAMTALTFALYLVLVGCSLGWCYWKKKDGPVRMGVAYGSVLVTITVVLIVYQVTTGVAYVDELVKEFTAIGSQTVQTYQTMGVFTADQLSQISSTMDQLMHNIGLIFPSAFLMAPFMVGWALVVMTDTVLKRTGHSIVPLNKLSHWQAPTSLKGFLLIIITFVLVVQVFQISAVPEIYKVTLMEIATFGYGVMGLSFIFWFIYRNKPKENMGVKTLIVILTVLVSPIMTIVTMIGVVDMYTSLRKVIIMKDGEKK